MDLIGAHVREALGSFKFCHFGIGMMAVNLDCHHFASLNMEGGLSESSLRRFGQPRR